MQWPHIYDLIYIFSPPKVTLVEIQNFISTKEIESPKNTFLKKVEFV